MSVRGEPATLVAEIETSLAVIGKIEAFYPSMYFRSPV
jgi:hypothetical protein